MKDKLTPTQIDYDHVTLILRDASKIGVEIEVKLLAEKYLNEGYNYVEAHQMAYSKFLK